MCQMYKCVTLAKWVDNPMEQINEMLYTNISVNGSCWVKQVDSVGFGCQPRVTTCSVTESQ